MLDLGLEGGEIFVELQLQHKRLMRRQELFLVSDACFLHSCPRSERSMLRPGGEEGGRALCVITDFVNSKVSGFRLYGIHTGHAVRSGFRL